MSASTAAAAGAVSTPRYVVAVDGEAAGSDLTSKEFLTSRPPGAYTTARTCTGGTRLFEWATHVRRTASSAAAMLAAGGGAIPDELAGLTQVGTLRPRVEATVAPAIREYTRAHGAGTELKATLLVTWEGGGAGSVACHVQPLPPLPVAPVRVEVRGAPRANALAKDSSWISERAPLEALMRDDMNELILATSTGELLEGSQTNFFAIQDGAVHTAGEGILEGTVRRLLLEVCSREGVPVVLRPPELSAVGSWQGALVSSTSRLLLPIDELFVPAEGKRSEDADMRQKFDTGPGSLAARLRDLVQGEVEAHSSQIV